MLKNHLFLIFSPEEEEFCDDLIKMAEYPDGFGRVMQVGRFYTSGFGEPFPAEPLQIVLVDLQGIPRDSQGKVPEDTTKLHPIQGNLQSYANDLVTAIVSAQSALNFMKGHLEEMAQDFQQSISSEAFAAHYSRKTRE